jgi:hypothetical protein
MEYQVVNPSSQDQRDTKTPLLLDFKLHNGKISANCSCQRLQKLHTKIKNEHPAARECPLPCGPQGIGPTKYHAMGGAQTYSTHTKLITLNRCMFMTHSMQEAVVQCFRQQSKEFLDG